MDDASGAIRIAAVMLSAPQSGMTQRPRLRSKRLCRGTPASRRGGAEQSLRGIQRQETSKKSGNSHRGHYQRLKPLQRVEEYEVPHNREKRKVSGDVSSAPKRPMTATFSAGI